MTPGPDSTIGRLRLREAKERWRRAHQPGYGGRHVLAGDENGNVAIAGTDLVIGRVSATGRPIIALNPTRRELLANEALVVEAMDEAAPAGWYVPGIQEVPRVCALYSAVSVVQWMNSPAWDNVFAGIPNEADEFATIYSSEFPFFGLRVFNGEAYVHETYSGSLMCIGAGGETRFVASQGGWPGEARHFSAGWLITANTTAPWQPNMQFDVGANGRIYFAAAAGAQDFGGSGGGTITDSIYSCDLYGGDLQLIASTGSQAWTQQGWGALFVAYSAYDETVYWGWNNLNTNQMVIRKYQGGVVSVVGGLAIDGAPAVGVSVLNRTLTGGEIITGLPSKTIPGPYAACDPQTGRLYWVSYLETTSRTIHCIDRNGIYQTAAVISHAHTGADANSLAIGMGCNRVTIATGSVRQASGTPYGYGIFRSGVDLDTGETSVHEVIVANDPAGAALGLPDAMIYAASLYPAYFHAMDANGSSDAIYFYTRTAASNDTASFSSPEDIGKQLLRVA